MLDALLAHPRSGAVRSTSDDGPPRSLTHPDLGTKRLLEEIRRLEAGAVDALHTMLQFAADGLSDRSVRVCVVALELGERLGLSTVDTRDLEFSALLHDIGFVGMPGEIFRKDGLMTLEERRLLMRHPKLGEAILGGIPGFERVGRIVGGHHEQPDGQGYPDALRGSEIPLPSRILSVAENFQAMMTDRTYRKRLPLAEAMAMLRAGAGSRFDESVVEQLGRDARAFERLLADRRLRLDRPDLCLLPRAPGSPN